jgi:hypothetical protein
MPGRHVAAASLPVHLRSRLEIRERDGVEPLFVGFEAQDEFERRVDEADWFLYLEDDLVLRDSLCGLRHARRDAFLKPGGLVLLVTCFSWRHHPGLPDGSQPGY